MAEILKKRGMMRLFAAALFALAALLVPFAAISGEKEADDGAIGSGAGFEGKVSLSGEGVTGAMVYAYRSFEDYRNSKPAFASRPTGADGRYAVDTPPGTYYLAALKTKGASGGPSEKGDLFSFHGSNPLRAVAGKRVRVGFTMVSFPAIAEYGPYDDQSSGGLTGVVTADGAPVEGAYVTLYVDTAEDLRGSSYASSPATDRSGAFRFDFLPEMDYYAVARKRVSGKPAGPLADGDFFGFFPLNPVAVRAGRSTGIEIPMAAKAGEISGGEGLLNGSGTVITGRVTDRNGKPVAGVYVFAYLEKVMSHKRPETISKAVDSEGNYLLNLKEGGTYYIGARVNYGDTPAIGEWYGRWEGTGDHSVSIKTGEIIKNIDITVEKILP